jgi:fermentation-respiration switch protein FrsA (DUF1100 family)
MSGAPSTHEDRPARRRRASWIPAIRALFLGYATLCVSVWFFQRRMLYFPDPSPVPPPSWPGAQQIELESADGVRTFSWYVPPRRGVTLVVFHGNAGHRGNGRADWIDGFVARGLGVFALDYRGYGGSGGRPSEQGFYLDAERAIDWLDANGGGKLVYLGESIGGGVAIEMSLRKPPLALIVQSTFTSIADTARATLPWTRILPLELIISDRFANGEKIARSSCPSLHIHGREDRLVPLALGEEIYRLALDPKELWIVDDAGHNDVVAVAGDEYYDRIARFISTHLRLGN